MLVSPPLTYKPSCRGCCGGAVKVGTALHACWCCGRFFGHRVATESQMVAQANCATGRPPGADELVGMCRYTWVAPTSSRDGGEEEKGADKDSARRRGSAVRLHPGTTRKNVNVVLQ